MKTTKDRYKDWENTFYEVYGSVIVKVWEENVRLKNPNKPEGNIGFEGGMDFQSWIKDFIRSLLLRKQKEIAEDICVIIDKIESRSDTNTLEEWKQYKAMRNAIRDKYVLKS